jgi:hypothetical protein
MTPDRGDETSSMKNRVASLDDRRTDGRHCIHLWRYWNFLGLYQDFRDLVIPEKYS